MRFFSQGFLFYSYPRSVRLVHVHVLGLQYILRVFKIVECYEELCLLFMAKYAS